MQTYQISKNSVFIGTPGNIIRVVDPPKNLEQMEFLVMAISKEYLSEIGFNFKKVFEDRLILLSDPCLKIEENDLKYCDKYLDLLRDVMESGVPSKRDAIGSLIASLFYLLAGLLEANLVKMSDGLASSSSATRVKLLFENFMSLVTEYHNSERSMSFYAGRLGLTPKYLSKLIKQVSGRSGPDWIDSFVILEAKNMLKYTDLTIKEIVYNLHFPNPSVFYKFFKAHTGQTPSEYRNG